MRKTNFAKVNVALDVVKKLPNGYHELDMVNVCVRLKDVVYMKLNDSGKINISSNVEKVPTDETNLVYKVILKVKEQFKLEFGCDVYLKKRIPLESGLGGGSGNAAAALSMLNKHFKLGMNQLQLINFIKPVSSDAPFQLIELPSRVKGIGDVVKPLDTTFKGKFLLIKPFEGNNTEKVFKNLDLANCVHPNINKVERAIVNRDVSLLSKHVGNSLLDAAIMETPKIKEIMDTLKEIGFEVVGLCGSGTTLYAYSKNKKLYKVAKSVFNKEDFELFGTYRSYHI